MWYYYKKYVVQHSISQPVRFAFLQRHKALCWHFCQSGGSRRKKSLDISSLCSWGERGNCYYKLSLFKKKQCRKVYETLIQLLHVYIFILKNRIFVTEYMYMNKYCISLKFVLQASLYAFHKLQVKLHITHVNVCYLVFSA